jgi:hypothetical protein
MSEEADSGWVAGFQNFLIQAFIATAGAMISAIAVTIILAGVTGVLTDNTSGGNWADHLIQQPVFYLVGEPWFIGPVLAGFVFGFFAWRWFRSITGLFVWVAPVLMLFVAIASWKTGGFQPYWRDVWDNFFGAGCGGSECLYEFFVTAPLYSSLAFSLGWGAHQFIDPKSRHRVR